jgi:hypothetical protein
MEVWAFTIGVPDLVAHPCTLEALMHGVNDMVDGLLVTSARTFHLSL